MSSKETNKTLKQILASHYTVFEYDSIELAVKEWLSQKHKEHLQKTSVIDHFQIIDELLEEFK
jgi:hypothetical protein